MNMKTSKGPHTQWRAAAAWITIIVFLATACSSGQNPNSVQEPPGSKPGRPAGVILEQEQAGDMITFRATITPFEDFPQARGSFTLPDMFTIISGTQIWTGALIANETQVLEIVTRVTGDPAGKVVFKLETFGSGTIESEISFDELSPEELAAQEALIPNGIPVTDGTGSTQPDFVDKKAPAPGSQMVTTPIPAADLTVVVEPYQPAVNETFNLSVYVYANIGLGDAALEITLPEIFEIVDGSTTWQGQLLAGERTRLSLQLRRISGGEGDILVSLTASDGTNVKTSRWFGPTADSTRSMGETAIRSAGTLYVSGRFTYHEDLSTTRGAYFSHVEVYDDDDGTADDFICSTGTDANGYWSCSGTASDDFPFDNTVEVYAKVWAKNSYYGTVHQDDTSKTEYQFSTSTVNANEGGDTVALGTADAPSDWDGAWHILKMMGYGNAFSSYIGGDAPPTSGQTNYLDVYWPTTVKSTSCNNGAKIWLLGPPKTDRDEWDEAVILHEYGHYINYLFADSNPPTVNYHGDSHQWGSHEDPETAYIEGWANYFQAGARKYRGMTDPHIYTDNTGTDTLTNNYETDCSTNAVTDTWNDSESTVTCILWDINDTPNDDQNADGVGDTIDRGGEEIHEVFSRYDPTGTHTTPWNIDEFYTGFLAKYTDDAAVKNIYFENGIDKGVQFTLTVSKAGTGTGTVTSSPTGISCGTDCSQAYNYNTSVTLTAAASTGHTFAGWSGACSGTGTCTVSMTTARSVTATFNINTYTLTVSKAGTGTGTVTSSPAGISCGTDCSQSYNYNTSVTLTAAASTGHTFAGWSGACSGTGTCTVSMIAAKSVTATFNINQYGLTVSKAGTGTGTVTSSPTGINCGTDCSESYNYNTSVTLTAAASTGNTFAGWSGACTGTGTCTVSMTAAKSVTATFNTGIYTLTVSKAGTGTGTVTSSPTGIDCGADCSESYTYNTSVTLTAATGTETTFAGWSGACSGTGTCTVSMTAARSVTATFNLNQYTLYVSKAGTGTGTVTSSPAGIDCGSDCSQDYNYNTSVTLTAAASTGNTFAGWSGACTGTSTCTISINTPRAVTATFNINQYGLTVSKAGTGTGTVTSSPTGIDCGADCSESYNYNTSVTLTAAPTTDHIFAGWSGACSGTGTCTITMSTAKSVTATFNAPGDQTLTVSKAGTGAGTVDSSPVGIKCGSTCSYAFAYNTGVTLTAAATSPSTFTGWGGACSGTGTCTVTMNSAKSVTATFNAPGDQTLTVSRNGTGTGTVASSPLGIDCGSTCSHAFAYDTQVTLTATATSPSIFAGWSGACSGTGTCIVTMSSARSVTATFHNGTNPVNDDFNTPLTIGSVPYTNTQDTSTATTAVDDPAFQCGSLNTGSNSVWYAFTPSENGFLTVKTEFSNFDTMLELWTGTRGSLTSIACNDDYNSIMSSRIDVSVQAGVQYFIEVTGYKYPTPAPANKTYSGDLDPSSGIVAASSGSLVLSVNLVTTPPPANDNFDTPVTIGSVPYTNTQDTFTATTAADDPDFHCGGYNTGSNSVWYTFTPSQAGTLTAKTEFSDFDTVLALWTGTRGSLTSVACNDDYNGILSSRIDVPVQAGVRYFIEVAGYKYPPPPAPVKNLQGGDRDPSLNTVAVSSGSMVLSVDLVTSHTIQTLTTRSVGAYDGWILESGENTNAGGTLDLASTTFNLGDGVADKQYRAILSFNTTALPDTAVITRVTLKILKQTQVGSNPFTILGWLKVDIRKPYFGTSLGLSASDFQAAVSRAAVGTFGATPVSNWYSAVIGSAGYPYINKFGTTQFRLRFVTDDNNDNGADFMKFYSGNYVTATARPTLVIEYYVP